MSRAQNGHRSISERQMVSRSRRDLLYVCPEHLMVSRSRRVLLYVCPERKMVSRSRRDLLYVCPNAKWPPEVVGTYFMYVRTPKMRRVRTCIKQVPTAATFAAPPSLAFVRTCCRDLLYACPLSPYGRNRPFDVVAPLRTCMSEKQTVLCISERQMVFRSRRDLLYVCPEHHKCVGYGHA